MTTARTWPLYAGALIGPLGGNMVHTMLPEMAAHLDASLARSSQSVSWYAVPFVVSLLFSGSLGARWRVTSTVRGAYLAYAAGSLLCSLAPTMDMFLLGRAAQGVANAFVTPLLVTLVADAAGPSRLNHAMGAYVSMSAAGQALAPLVGGVSAAVDYRLGFVGFAVLCVTLAAATPRSGPSIRQGSAQQVRSLANVTLVRAGVIAFCGYLCTSGLLIMGALRFTDSFGLTPAYRGAAVATFGAVGLLTGSVNARAAEAWGLRRHGTLCLVVLAVTSAAAGVAPSAGALVLLLAVAGWASITVRMLSSAMALSSTPANRAGATSVMLAAQFAAAAVVPVVIAGLYTDSAAAAFLVGALACAVAALVAVTARDAVAVAPASER